MDLMASRKFGVVVLKMIDFDILLLNSFYSVDFLKSIELILIKWKYVEVRSHSVSLVPSHLRKCKA